MASRAPLIASALSLHPAPEAGWREALLATLAFALALLAVWRLAPGYGASVAALLTVPLAMLAWSFGLKGALVGSALALPVSAAICLRATLAPGVFTVASGHLGVLFIGCVTGRLRDLSVRVARELEEHARAARLLRQSEARNQALLSALPDLIFRLDVTGKVTGASGGRGRANSLRSAAYLDQLLPVDVAEAMRERVREVLQSGQPGELEYSVSEDTEKRDYEARLVRCAPDQVLVIVRNVTRQKRLARELIAAKEAALEAARSKTKFLANMSHEIRTPMNGVIGMTTLLLETTLGSEQREYAQIIQKSGQALLGIIDDILDFAKIEAGRLELDLIEFDLHASVEESLEAFAGQAYAKSLDLGCVFEQAVPRRVRGDPTRLRQVLASLVGNAVKYTEQGHVLLEVGLAEPGAPERLRFRVRDTGPGIAPELVPRLFRPLLLGESGTGATRDGTGLGLAIARELVQLMDGEIRYEEPLGEGAAFCFEVRLEVIEVRASVREPNMGDALAAMREPNRVNAPASAREREVSDAREANRAGAADGGSEVAGGRVLIVRPSVSPSRLLDRQLQSLGVAPECASEAELLPALARVRGQGRPYLAVLIEGGRDLSAHARVVAALRREDMPEPVPIVLILAAEARGGLHEELRRSATRVLHWPVRRAELAGCLSALLGRSEAQPAPLAHSRRLSARVLVVDDDPVNRRVAQRTLELIGCSCELAENGRQAVEAVRRDVFDLVLMDCQMPGLDGFEAAREIRTRERGRRTPIVAMTAGVADADREHARAAQMDGYITKPVTPEQLRDTIAALLAPAAESQPQSRARTPPGGELLDRRTLEELMVLGGGDPDFLRGLVQVFNEQAPRHLQVVRAALDVGDLVAAAKAAHTLKSSSGYLGARRLAELCKELELRARAGEHGEVARISEALNAEYDAVRHALLTELS